MIQLGSLLISVLSGFNILGQQVTPKYNSPYDEQNPVLSVDGKTLYFTRSNHPGNAGGKTDPGDIWYSKWQGDSWSDPENARELNNKSWNGVIGFSSDGRTIYLHNQYDQRRSQGVSFAHRTRDGWSHPESLKIPYFKNESSIYGATISSDGNTLVFAIQSYGTRGGEDLYVSFKSDRGWSEPKNLGKTINTRYQEFTPFLMPDDSTLYFSSNGHSGEGSSDVFVSHRLDDTWTNWTEPEGIPGINTDGRELGYRVYPGLVIYTSTRNSDGYGDIRFNYDNPADSTHIVFDTLSTIENVPVIVAGPRVYGTIMNAESRGVVRSKITVRNTTGEVVLEEENNGRYNIVLPRPGEYLVRVDAPQYMSYQSTVETIESEKHQLDIALQPMTVGTRVNLSNVLFKQSKAEMIESSFAELNLVVDFMKQNPDIKIRLEGHTDNRGNPRHNLKLSKRRVEAVEEYLVKKGIADKRISGKGYGGNKPIADNDDPEQRKLNRRVEFIIVKN